MSPELLILIPAAVTLVGLVVIGLAVRHLILAHRFARTAVATTGTVVQVQTQAPGGGSNINMSDSVYFPTVRFTTASGQNVEFTPRVGSNLDPHTVGRQVPVLYQPNDPTSARINTFALRRVGPGCLLTVGIFLTAGGGVVTAVFAFIILSIHNTH